MKTNLIILALLLQSCGSGQASPQNTSVIPVLPGDTGVNCKSHKDSMNPSGLPSGTIEYQIRHHQTSGYWDVWCRYTPDDPAFSAQEGSATYYKAIGNGFLNCTADSERITFKLAGSTESVDFWTPGEAVYTQAFAASECPAI